MHRMHRLVPSRPVLPRLAPSCPVCRSPQQFQKMSPKQQQQIQKHEDLGGLIVQLQTSNQLKAPVPKPA